MQEDMEWIRNDPGLEPYRTTILRRAAKARAKEAELLEDMTSLRQFATGHLHYGIHKGKQLWTLREWAPQAQAIYLIGEFSRWQDEAPFAFQRQEAGNWLLELPLDVLRHGDLYKLRIHWPGGSGERIPAWATRVVQDHGTLIFSAQVWDPPVPYRWELPDYRRSDEPPLIYEAHVGMATEAERVGTYDEFRRLVLPRIVKAGYNTLQLMAIQEHPYYGSFGYQVSSFFAASSRFGTPEELKALIDAAHQANIAVIMDLVHSHAVKNDVEGIGRYDGSPYQFFHAGARREHPAWNSLCFDYGRNEVIHFLLSNCAYWLGEYRFDGFRFDGITSMLYLDHGLGKNFAGYDMYYDGSQDEDAIVYLTLANRLIHDIRPDAVTVAEDMSGMPGLVAPLRGGGYGFDYRLAMGVPDFWIKMIKEVPDENWKVGEIYHELTNRRLEEKAIGYAESHDQALVGDQTIIFRLLGREMYDRMDKRSPSPIIDRGLALHKMIRLVTIATAGAGYLNFMGNEFGHPEWIDFPREGNDWSYHYARRQWRLAADPELRYHLLADFDRAMLALMKEGQVFCHPFPVLRWAGNPDQILAFERDDLLFVFNFHPFQSYRTYNLPAPPGKYRIILTTDDFAYGGFGRIDQSLDYFSRRYDEPSSPGFDVLKLYLPSRSALVLKRIPEPGAK